MECLNALNHVRNVSAMCYAIHKRHRVIIALLLLSMPWAGFSTDYFTDGGFESANPPAATVWYSSSPNYTINTNGVVTTTAHSGTKSYCVDISLSGATAVYLAFNLSPEIPCEGGGLNFSCMVKVEKVSGGTPYAGFGDNVVFMPQTNITGCGPYSKLTSTSNEWMPVNKNLAQTAIDRKENFINKYIDKASRSHVGIKLNKLGFFIYGATGDRIRIYVDDIKLHGSVPTLSTYVATVDANWSAYTSKFTSQINTFSANQTSYAAAINALSNIQPGIETTLRNRALSLLSDAGGMITIANSRGYFSPGEYDQIDYRQKQAMGIVQNIVDARGNVILRDKHLLYKVDPTRKSVQGVLDDADFITADIKSAITLNAAPEEYEPASFAIEAFENLDNLTVDITPLMCGSKMLPAASVDIRSVKCWYQNGSDIIGHTYETDGTTLIRTLTPELLLKNDDLVRVDHSSKTNAIRRNSLTDYADVSVQDTSTSGWMVLLNSDWGYLYDDALLQPVDINNTFYKQFWVNVNVPSGTPAGEYSGYLRISALIGGVTTQIGKYKFSVNVLPFNLAESNLTYGIYYEGMIQAVGGGYYNGTIASGWLSRTQYGNQMKNILAHGVKNPNCNQQYTGLTSELTLIQEALQARTDAGMNNNTFFSNFSAGNSSDPATLATLKTNIGNLKTAIASKGYSNLYIYGLDETVGDSLLAQRDAWIATHEAGAKIFLAGFKGTLPLEYPYGQRLSLHFDETSGTILKDSSAYRNDGTLPGNGVGLVSGGKIGRAVEVTTAGNGINCGNGASLAIADNITIEAWIYPTSAAQQRPFIHKVSTSDWLGNYAMYLNTDRTIVVYAKTSNNGNWKSVSPVSAAITLNQWSHIVWTYSSAAGGRLYINNVSQGSAANTLGTLVTDNSHPLIIGRVPGKFDELKIYSRILTAEEITRQYNNGNGDRQTVAQLKDMHIGGYALDSAESTTMHAAGDGKKILSYDNPQCGLENPEIYRRNFGLKLWKYGYDGAMNFTYSSNFRHPWNDFDHINYKDHNFVYPTNNGVIDTIQWEGFREGIDDTRYLATLQNAINAAPASPEKTAAQAYITAMQDTTSGANNDILEVNDLDETRNTLAGHIQKLSGIRGIWNFNENSGTTAYDSSPWGNNGTLTTGVIWSDGVDGGALQFDGASSKYVNCGAAGSSSSQAIADNITIETWLYPTAVPAGGNVPIARWNWSNWGVNANYAMYFLSGTDQRKIQFYATAGGTWKVVSPKSNAISLNSWHHIVWTYNSSSGGKLYIDGTDQGNAVGTGTLYTDTTSPLTLGRYFTGKMDSVRVYNKVLTLAEITKSFMLGNDRCRIWNSDESSGALLDSSPNAKNGTLSGNVNRVSRGSGYALNFTGGYVNCGNDSSLNIMNYTVMGWVKPSGAGTVRPIIQRGNMVGSPLSGLYMQLYSDNVLYIYQIVNGSSLATWTTSAFPSDGNYHHVAMVFDYDGKTSTIKLYIDGAYKNSNSSIGKPTLAPENETLYLGIGMYSLKFNGQLDGFKIYSRALSETEIVNDYNNP